MDTVRFSAIVIPEFAGKHLLLTLAEGGGEGKGKREERVGVDGEWGKG